MIEVYALNIRKNFFHCHTYLPIPFVINDGIVFVQIIFIAVPCELNSVWQINIYQITCFFSCAIIDSVLPTKSF